jgi:hypothetical protein
VGEVVHKAIDDAGQAEVELALGVGTAAGEAYQAASDPEREFDFGLARIVDGLMDHLAHKQR